ncbi:MAG: NFACT family protein [Methanomassiliicoccaceae archaeon]|jgi:predicted ribosome quality control (RQC) complex YloA/Tae2 family protein|nr:NFACT family protein [Methanomassiliicoccaceae archaeon]
MKKEMSAFDVRATVKEMGILEGSHMDKIFHWGAGNVLFRLNVQGQGKKELFFEDKKWLYMPASKPETPSAPTSFASFLRKYVDNARVGKITQIGFDRIVIVELFKAEGTYDLIFEMFGGGNVLLVLDGKIVNCLTHKARRDRITRPGEDYVMPRSRFDPTTGAFAQFEQILVSSATDLVRTLAMDANLGGQYAEEICKRTGIAKNTKPADLRGDDVVRIHAAMNDIVSAALSSANAVMYMNGDDVVEIAPVELQIYEGYEKRVLGSVSEAIASMIESVKEAEEEESVDPEVEKLRRRVDKQRETIDEYRGEAADLKARADSIYTNYQKVNELLDVLSAQSKKLGWDKLKEGAMRIPFVNSIDPSKNIVTADLDGMKVMLDYTKGIDANASDIYQRGKEMNDKATRATDALKESEEQLERKQKGFAKAKALALTRAQPTKQFWFERYKWFITSNGLMVLSGRDAHTNDQLIKKHMKEQDVYVHADVHGAPSVVIKNGSAAKAEDLREACVFALTQSKAWTSSMPEGSAFWVYPDQVSKTPQAGEFVPRGAFIIRGKRNYEYHLPMQLSIGEISYEGSRKVMCGPIGAVSKMSRRYVTIVPTKTKGNKKNAELAKLFNVPEEEISRITPPGEIDVTDKVWTDEE